MPGEGGHGPDSWPLLDLDGIDRRAETGDVDPADVRALTAGHRRLLAGLAAAESERDQLHRHRDTLVDLVQTGQRLAHDAGCGPGCTTHQHLPGLLTGIGGLVADLERARATAVALEQECAELRQACRRVTDEEPVTCADTDALGGVTDGMSAARIVTAAALARTSPWNDQPPEGDD